MPTPTPQPAAQKLTGAVLASSAAGWGGKPNGPANAFDGNPASFVDLQEPAGWIGIDAGNQFTLTSATVTPRPGFAIRCTGALIQGASKPDFSDAITLATINAPVTNGPAIPLSGIFRYVRYVSPAGGHCNVSELAFYGVPYFPPVSSIHTPQAAYPTGWTTPAAAAHTYFVDGQAGSDSNVGTSAATPFQTTGPALKHLVDGDAILFANGSTNAPFVAWVQAANIYVGTYGDPAKPRPVVNVTGSGVGLHAKAAGTLIQYIDFRGDRTNGKGVILEGIGQRIEGCSLTGFFQATNIVNAASVTAYRCNLSRNYSPTASGHSQGGYVDKSTDVLFDSCTINYNGWDGANPATATMFNHGLYLDDDQQPFAPVRLHNCIIAENSAWGVEGRSGGIADDCLFIDNGIHGGGVYLGGNGPEGANCVFTGALDAPARSTPRGIGFGLWAPDGLVHDCIFANSAGIVGPAISIGAVESNKLDPLQGTATISNNLVSGWQGWAVHFDVGRKQVTLTGNKFGSAGGAPLIDIHVKPGAVSASGNVYSPGAIVRYVDGHTVPLASCVAMFGDATTAGAVPTATLTIEQYAQSVGLPASGEALLRAAEANCGAGWSDALSAGHVNAAVRASVK